MINIIYKKNPNRPSLYGSLLRKARLLVTICTSISCAPNIGIWEDRRPHSASASLRLDSRPHLSTPPEVRLRRQRHAMSKPADQQPSDMQVDSSVAEEKPAIRFSINGELTFPIHESSGDMAPCSFS